MLAALLPTGSTLAQSDDGLEPFVCTGEAFTVRGNPTQAQLFLIDQTVEPFDFTPIGMPAMGPFGIGGSPIALQLNNLGYRVADNLLYAVAMPLSGNSNFGIVTIDMTGTVTPFLPATTPGWPANVRLLAGDVSVDGKTMYVNTYPTSKLYIVDLEAKTVTNVTISGGEKYVADWAVNPDDGNLYGGEANGSGLANVYQLTPAGALTDLGQVAGLLRQGGNGQYFGGSWFMSDGTLVLYRNSDFIYCINLLTSPPTLMDEFEGDGVDSTLNDAAACAAINPPLIDKFYTHTWNDWSLRCAAYVIDPLTGEETDECAEYRLPNINDDDDIFADNLPTSGGAFVLTGKVRGKKTVVNPGQYIAVSNVSVYATQDVWVLEDFSACVDPDFGIGNVFPFNVPGGVQVVLIDDDGNVHDIDDDLALGIGGWIDLQPNYARVHVENVLAGSVLRVMVKFQPYNDTDRPMIGRVCKNREVLQEPVGEDEFVDIEDAEATANLIVIDQDLFVE